MNCEPPLVMFWRSIRLYGGLAVVVVASNFHKDLHTTPPVAILISLFIGVGLIGSAALPRMRDTSRLLRENSADLDKSEPKEPTERWVDMSAIEEEQETPAKGDVRFVTPQMTRQSSFPINNITESGWYVIWTTTFSGPHKSWQEAKDAAARGVAKPPTKSSLPYYDAICTGVSVAISHDDWRGLAEVLYRYAKRIEGQSAVPVEETLILLVYRLACTPIENRELIRAVFEFAHAMIDKAIATSHKPGRGDSWKKSDWHQQLCTAIREHADKGDPVDVGLLAAFAHYHGWSLNPPMQDATPYGGSHSSKPATEHPLPICDPDSYERE